MLLVTKKIYKLYRAIPLISESQNFGTWQKWIVIIAVYKSATKKGYPWMEVSMET